MVSESRAKRGQAEAVHPYRRQTYVATLAAVAVVSFVAWRSSRQDLKRVEGEV